MLEPLLDRGDAAMVSISSLLVAAAAAVGSTVVLRDKDKGAAVRRGQVREGRHHSIACVAVHGHVCCLERDSVGLVGAYFLVAAKK